MAWIKIQNGLVTNKKTARLAGQMKWTKLQAVGFLVSFWIWAVENCEDGQLKDITDNEIAFAVGLESAEGILRALRVSGLVDNTPLRIHDWPEYQHEYLRGKYRREPEKHQKIIDLYRVCTGTVPDRERDRERDRKKETIIYSVEFLEFWKAYPYKTGKDVAWAAWQKKKPNLQTCLATLSWQTRQESWIKDKGQFIPMPTTWLNQGRWADEPIQRSRPHYQTAPTGPSSPSGWTAEETRQAREAREAKK